MFVRLLLMLLLAVQVSTGIARATEPPVTGAEKRIPFKGSEGSETGVSVLRVVLGFGVVAAVGFGAILAMRRFLPLSYAGKPAATRNIELVEVRRLTPKLTLFLIQVEGERVLLAQSGDVVTRIHPLQPAGSRSGDAEASRV